MRTLILVVALGLLTNAAHATPCDDARKDFARAKKFGAYDFHCVDRYDGTATSSWRMLPEDFKAFRAAERQRRKKK